MSTTTDLRAAAEAATYKFDHRPSMILGISNVMPNHQHVGAIVECVRPLVKARDAEIELLKRDLATAQKDAQRFKALEHLAPHIGSEVEYCIGIEKHEDGAWYVTTESRIGTVMEIGQGRTLAEAVDAVDPDEVARAFER